MKKLILLPLLLVALLLPAQSLAASPVINKVKVFCDFKGITSLGPYCAVRVSAKKAKSVRITIDGIGSMRARRSGVSTFGPEYVWRSPTLKPGRFKGKNGVNVTVSAKNPKGSSSKSFNSKVIKFY